MKVSTTYWTSNSFKCWFLGVTLWYFWHFSLKLLIVYTFYLCLTTKKPTVTLSRMFPNWYLFPHMKSLLWIRGHRFLFQFALLHLANSGLCWKAAMSSCTVAVWVSHDSSLRPASCPHSASLHSLVLGLVLILLLVNLGQLLSSLRTHKETSIPLCAITD